MLSAPLLYANNTFNAWHLPNNSGDDSQKNRVRIAVTGHLSEGSFVRNLVVQIPKFDANPNPNPSPNPLPIYTLRTNDPSDTVTEKCMSFFPENERRFVSAMM